MRLIAFILAAFVVACGGSNPSPNPTPTPTPTPGAAKLSKIGISNARTLFVAGASQTAALRTASRVRSAAEEGPVLLLQITGDGTVLEVTSTCTDETGAEVTCTETLTPRAVHNAGPDHVWIDYVSEQALVRKADNAAFLVSKYGPPRPPMHTTAKNVPLIQSDAHHGIYTLAPRAGGSYGIVKLDATAPDAIADSFITDENEQVVAFAVEASGTVFYRTFTAQRVRFPNGALASYEVIDGSWKGLDGKLYRLDRSPGQENDASPIMSVYSVNVSGEQITFTRHAQIGAIGWFEWVLPAGERLYLLNGGQISNNVLEVQNPDNVIVHTVPCVPGVLHPTFIASPAAIWMTTPTYEGTTGLARWNAAEGCSAPVIGAEYDVIAFTVGADDVAEFTAIRASDGKRVLASVNAAGTITVLDEGIAATATTLERI